MLLSRRKGWFGTEAKTPLGKIVFRAGKYSLVANTLTIVFALCTVGLLVAVISQRTPAELAAQENVGKSPQIQSLAEHIYLVHDSPFFNESVTDNRSRLEMALSSTRPNTIFVSLASFRDNTCQHTLMSLFTKAKYPANVFVGLVDQALLPDSLKGQIRVVQLDAATSQGPTHARYIASKLWDGEEVFMQIDAHSVFLQDWDDLLLSNLEAMPNPHRAILSHYPVGAESDLGDHVRQWVCMAQIEHAPPGLIYQVPDWCQDENMADGIALNQNGEKTTCYAPFIGAGFIAGHARWVHDVPFDKYLPFLFHGEELLIAARLWTSGWDLFTPQFNLLTHVYGERRKNVFNEQPNWSIFTAKSETTDMRELEELGMGSERSLAAYLDYAGIRLGRNVTLTPRCGMKYTGSEWVVAR